MEKSATVDEEWTGSRSNFVGVLLLIRNARSRETYDVDGITNGSSCYSHLEN